MISLADLSTLVNRTSTPVLNEDGSLNKSNATNLINLNTCTTIIQNLADADDVQAAAEVLTTRDTLILEIKHHKRCIAGNRQTPSQQLAQQNKAHWTDDQIKQWIKTIELQEQQQQQLKRMLRTTHHHHHNNNNQQQSKRISPTTGYTNLNDHAVTVARQRIHQVGDIFFDTPMGGGYLYPRCVGKYYEPVDPITFNEMEALLKEVKGILQKQMLLQTNKQQLTENMRNSIDEIKMENVVGFLLQSSIGDFIDVIPGMPQPWLYLQSIVSFNNYGHYALLYLPTLTDFVSNEWQSKSKLPPIIPDSPSIQAILTRFRKVKHTGYAFPASAEENKHFFLLSKAYRRFFESGDWDWKEKNECFVKWDGVKCKLIPQKAGKKGEYKFLKLAQVE